jgi:hypothetical protein
MQFGHAARLIACALAFVCLAAHADNGTTVFVSGPVGVVQASGRLGSLAKGNDIKVGDLVRVGPNGRAQIRFPDGAYLSLMPGAELRVDAYRFGGNAKGKETAFFTLFRGATRFLAGAIGKAPGSRFRVTTPSAVVEVRISEFVVVVVGQGVQVTVGAGQLSVRNDAGALTLNAGQRGFVADRSTLPYLVGNVIPDRIAP